MFNAFPDVLNVEQLAEALGVGRNKAYELVHENMIGSIRVGRRILIPKMCLIDYMLSARYKVCL
jgi:excisionase family DNA binding protein